MLQALVKIWRFLERWGPSLFAGFLAFILLTAFPGVAGVLFGLFLVALIYAIDTDHLCGRALEQLVDKIVKALRPHTPEERIVATMALFLFGAILCLIAGLSVSLIGASEENDFLKGVLFVPTLLTSWALMVMAAYIRRYLENPAESSAPKE